ncbi:uncharacterized protein B0J16DRAFT_319377 [Fusarium flagelliforme]|uniref:uncharacterized protein n=1 Tax=Fusarium flagelliforme TaxID=2675880 RepID=UPI001E8ED93B|nr:uncharacterized protein B0J16DRAFT_319377 [Fusarium flagelliforme]KAH7184574.1 hypothetical protein B0J16DRAFT_319377 [Fusarium flagelliforme]
MDNKMNPTILCAENICLLFLLHSVPSVPKATPLGGDQISEAGYSLPFEKERALASTLAFLSSIREDPNRIPALCIESASASCSLRVHIAVNKSNFLDGNIHLLEMDRALRKILAPLSNYSNANDRPDTVKDVFDVIVTVCEARILNRLHLGPSNKKKTKKPTVETLSLAITSLRQLRKKISSRGGLVNSASSFEDRANGAIKLITAWTKHQTTSRLRDIVEAIHELWTIERLEELLHCIPNNLMDPGLRSSLHNMIRKVARYKEAARYLCRMAKKFPCVRRAEVVSVTLQQEMFAKPVVDGYTPSLSTTLHRISSKRGSSANLSRICALLKVNAVRTERLFSDHVLRALQGAKVHAEIQLFYHIEMLRLPHPPRVVCSSKDACYLCDFFITTGTKFHSPKCHGRLYPGWRLPALSAQDETLRRFNDHLEEEACNSIKNLLKTQKKFSLPDPRESTILTIRQSVSTLPTPSANLDEARDDFNMTSDKASSDDLKSSTAIVSNSCLQAAGDVLEHPVACHDGNTTRQSLVLAASHDQSQALSPSGNQGETHQKHDPKRSNPITVCVAQDNVLDFRFGPIRLHVEYSACHNGSMGDIRKDLTFDTEWITDVKDQLTNDHPGSSLIDIGKSTYTASLPLDKLNQLDINHEGKVLRIRLHP